MVSPMRKGRSTRIQTPAKKFLRMSCSERPMTRPRMLNEVRIAPKFGPVKIARMISSPTVRIASRARLPRRTTAWLCARIRSSTRIVAPRTTRARSQAATATPSDHSVR
jgi:hypothetical protein